MADVINTFGIDVETKAKNNLIRRLKALKATKEVTDGGIYHQAPECSQVHIATEWDEEKLENWLWATKGVDYIGVFAR
jgi:hydrogenase maturation factor HypE